MANSNYQFGIDDGKVTKEEANGSLASSSVDILAIKTFSITNESETVSQTGDNKTVRTRRTGKNANGSVSQGATDLPVYAVVGDGVVTTTGTTPNVVTTYTEPDKSPGRRYQLQVQAADIDGATRITVPRAVTTAGPSFEWNESAFSDPSWDYEAQTNASNLFTIAQYETEVALT